MNYLKMAYEKFKISLKNPIYLRLLINFLLSLIFFLIYVNVYVMNAEADEIKGAAVMIVAYVVTVIVWGLLQRILFIKVPPSPIDVSESFFGNLTVDLMNNLRMPVVICDKNEKIIWYNDMLAVKLGTRDSMYGKTIKTICGHSTSEITADTNPDGLETAIGDKIFRIKSYKSMTHEMSIILFNDFTELVNAYKRLKEKDTLVGYIIIDNLDELMQLVNVNYRLTSSNVVDVLREWTDSFNGILKEYERDKFLFLCDAKNLDTFIANKFSILDKIRDIRVGEGSLPVTISIGISKIEGQLADKEKAARQALDMALQRGGDQVVVKGEETIDLFGARVKSMQKRTKVKARVIANDLIMLMAKSTNVLIMAHKNADFDAIGACAGIARIGFFCGTKVNIIVNKKDVNMFKCYDKLNRIPEYNYSDGGTGVFTDSAEAQDLITSETLLIIVDTSNVNQFESPEIAYNTRNIVIIDHHRKNAEFKFAEEPILQYIEPSASSTCELISEILEQSLPSGSLHKDETEVMFAGILVDTVQFTRNTGVRTFGAVLYLRAEGANPVEAHALFDVSLEDFRREARFEANIFTYRNTIAIAVNDRDDNTNIDRISAAKAADKLLKIENITASFALCKIGDIIHISARSSGTFNVQIIIEKLGGGGHFDAAATQIADTDVDNALNRLKKAIDDALFNKR